MANSNRNVIYQRTMSAARQLSEALEEASACQAEFIALGGNVWTDPFFHEGEDLNNPLRTDLSMNKQDLVNAQIAFDVLGNGKETVQPSDYYAFIFKAK
jgi:hypothetical protein